MITVRHQSVLQLLALQTVLMLQVWTGGCRQTTCLEATIARAKTGFVADRVSACQRLAKFSAEPERNVAAQVLAEALTDKEPLVRQAAARSLADMEYVQAGKQIMPLLRDPSPNVRMDAVGALARLRVAEAYPAILDTLQLDKSISVRAVAAEAVGEFGRSDVVAILSKAFRDESSGVVQRAIVETVGRMSTPDAEGFLNEASQAPGLGGDAARRLLQHHSALPQLRRLADGDHSHRVGEDSARPAGEPDLLSVRCDGAADA